MTWCKGFRLVGRNCTDTPLHANIVPKIIQRFLAVFSDMVAELTDKVSMTRWQGAGAIGPPVPFGAFCGVYLSTLVCLVLHFLSLATAHTLSLWGQGGMAGGRMTGTGTGRHRHGMEGAGGMTKTAEILAGGRSFRPPPTDRGGCFRNRRSVANRPENPLPLDISYIFYPNSLTFSAMSSYVDSCRFYVG